MKRVADGRELLDGALDDRATLEGNLRDLCRVNALLGGVTLSLRAIEWFASRDVTDNAPGVAGLRVLDVGTGAADIPVGVRRRWSGSTPVPTLTATDSRREVLDAARSIHGALGLMPGVELALADGRALPWPDGAFNVAHASMVLHHLDPPDAVAFLCELRRVARRGVIVNDL